MFMPVENEKKEKYLRGNKRQDEKEDQKDLVGKSLDNESIRDRLPRCISQDGLFASQSISFLKEVRFSEQKFPAGSFVSNIKYNYRRSQNNNLFYPLYDQPEYVSTHYYIIYRL